MESNITGLNHKIKIKYISDGINSKPLLGFEIRVDIGMS
jgi:hypothetical protein